MAAISVASGQGEIAVNRPKRKAVRTGVVLLSSNVCNHSIALLQCLVDHLCQTFLERFWLSARMSEGKFRQVLSLLLAILVLDKELRRPGNFVLLRYPGVLLLRNVYHAIDYFARLHLLDELGFQ